MALDKNYIDTTTFDVLQPAIDYYLKKGTPDEELRTYYYQGRIYQNQGDRNKALNSFVKSTDNIKDCTDSLTIIRALVGQSYLYDEFYDFKSYVNRNLLAADISRKISQKDYEIHCLLNALNGAITEDDKQLADSIMTLCNGIDSINDAQRQRRLGLTLAYVENFGSKDDLKRLIENNADQFWDDANTALNLASAYNELGNNRMALQVLNHVRESGESLII